MGADLSSRSVALILVETETGQSQALKVSVSDKIMNRHEIIRQLSASVGSWLAEKRPDVLYIEEPLVAGARNLQSSLKIAQVAGALLCLSAGMERVYLVPVSTWKKDTVGHGNATKPEVRAWVDQHYPSIASVCGLDQDLYDAAAVALYGQGCLARSDKLGSEFCAQSLAP